MELHIGRYPRLPMTILGPRDHLGGMQSKKRDDLEYLQLMKERQLRACQLVVEKGRLTKEKHRVNNEAIDNALTKRTTYQAGMWVWCYDPQHIIRTSSGDSRRDKTAVNNRIKEKLVKLWTGPFKILSTVGPCRFREMAVGPKLL